MSGAGIPGGGLGVTAIGMGVGAAVLLAQLPLLDRSVVPVDEGQLLAIADRIRHGEALYRDVYTGIFPGIYYATALLLSTFGADVIVTRWAAALVNAATAAALFGLAVRVVRPGFALLPPLLYAALVALGFPGLSMLNYSSLSLGLALFALCFLLRRLARGRRRDAIACGLLLGLCGLVKQNFGALAVLGVMLGLVSARGAGPHRPLAAAAGPILAAGAALTGLAAAALAGAGALGACLEQTLLGIGESQLTAYADPLPPIFGAHPADDGRFVFLYTPAALFNYLMRGETLFGLALTPALRGLAIRLAYGGALATLAAGALLLCVDRGGEPQARAARRAIVLFALLLFLGIFPSAIWSHLAFVLAPVLLVLALVADRVDAALRARLRALALAWRGSLLALALAAAALAVHISLDVPRWYPTPLDLPRGSLRVSAQQHALLHGATQFLVRCAGPDEKVFVAPDLPLLYFLANRRNPTPYDLVIPGAIDGERIVERLRESGTRCVVYNPQIYSQFAPFAELFPEVAEVLARDYRRVATIGSAGAEWHALVRREPGGA